MKCKKLLCCMVIVAMVLSMSVTSLAVSPEDFQDMPDNWATEALENAVNNGLLTGIDGKIMPDENLTRAQMATIINRAFGAIQKADVSAYTDVESGAWYTDEIAKAVKMGTFKGTGDGCMFPDNPITRQEAFAVMARGLGLNNGNATALDSYNDANKISAWAKAEVAALAEAGYVQGAGGQLNPLANITRAEFAKLMDNMVSQYFSKADTYTEVAEGNVMINTADVVLKGVTVNGDLIIGDGVGTGDFTFDNCTVTGRMVVRGGGANSIVVTNSKINKSIVVFNPNNTVRIVSAGGTVIDNVSTETATVFEGDFGKITVAGNSEVKVTGNVSNIVVNSDATLRLVNAKVDSIEVKGGETGAEINVSSNSTVQKIVAETAGTEITGTGDVKEVEANANDVKVDTPNTEVSAAEGVTGVEAGGEAVDPGTSTSVPPASSGGGGGGGSSSKEQNLQIKVLDSNDKIVRAVNIPCTDSKKLIDVANDFVNDETKAEAIQSYLDEVNGKLANVKFADGQNVYSNETWTSLNAIFNVKGVNEFDSLKPDNFDSVGIDYLKDLPLKYRKVFADQNISTDAIVENITNNISDKTVKYTDAKGNVYTANFELTVKDKTITTVKEAVAYAAENALYKDLTVGEFFETFGTEITLTVELKNEADEVVKTAEVVIKKVFL